MYLNPKNLVGSMPRRLGDVIGREGKATSYQPEELSTFFRPNRSNKEIQLI
jgi:hypothetical protein